MLWSSASLAPTHIIHDNKLVSEHYRDCNGNSSAHVQGRRQLDLLSGLCINTTQHLPTMLMYCNPHAHAHYLYRFKGYFLSVQVHMANLSATG